MKNNTNNRKSKLLALLLSAMMLSSVAALTACGGGGDDSSSSSSSTSTEATVNDTQKVKNGGFETFNTNDGKNAIGTNVTGWGTVNKLSTSTGSSLDSQAESGIIDTDAEAWKTLTGSYFNNPDDVKDLTETEAENLWEDLTTKDKLAYYDAWKEANKDKKITDELKDFYTAFNVDSTDIPDCKNPGTHLKEGDEGYGEDTNVLMIHNEYPAKNADATYKGVGTAQKFTSTSTVTVEAGTAAYFSVWVKTQDLMSTDTHGNMQEAVGKGAYISVNHSVGGKSLPGYKVENINTENMDLSDTNGWKQYTFYLKGSSYATTTFTIELGLGQGGGTDRLQYVNGYAFFDDIECDVVTAAEYHDFLTNAGIDESEAAAFDWTKEQKTVDVSKITDKDTFAMNFYGAFEETSVLDNVSVTATEGKANGETVTSVKGQNPAAWLGDGFDGTNDVDGNKVFENLEAIGETAETTGNKYLKAIYEDYFQNDDYFKTNPEIENESVLLLLSTQGAAYTATSNYVFNFVDPEDNTKYVDYLAISFFVKTSDMKGITGGGVTINDGDNKTSFATLDTTSITAVEIGGEEDYYDGWQQCFFFVENTSENKDATFTLSFNLGPTAIDSDVKKANFAIGFAAFTDFRVYAMTADEYESATDGSYSKLVQVTGKTETEAEGDSGFDSATAVPTGAIEEGIAHPRNYKGVYSDSYYVNQPTKNESAEVIAQKTAINQHESAGLLNKEYFLEYFTTTDAPVWMQQLTKWSGKDTASEVWSSIFGNATQPLMIINNGASDKAYGYIGKSTTISANTYQAISVRVKVAGANTKAYVYLIDMDDTTYSSTLSIGGNLTYWYDANGNICTGDPSERTSEVAFKLQSNGLYQVNPRWSQASTIADKSAYYANLDAYTELDENGNKLVGENGASHQYSDSWKNEGEDGIAYYYNAENNTYYADRAKTIPVINLSTVSSLPARYAAQAEKDMFFEVGDTNGEWATVTFYVHTGSDAKNYRLEVWSGERNGAANPTATMDEASYVLFDCNNPGDASTNMPDLLEEYEDKVADGDKFEGVFSYFDTDKFLRYNSSLDDKGYGNLYADNYDATAQTEGIAYLKHVENGSYTMFADYSFTEQTVTADSPDDGTNDDTNDDESDVEGTNPWMAAASIILAVVLLAAVGVIIVRKVVKKVRKTKGYTHKKK